MWKPNGMRRTADLMLLGTVVLWALNFTVTKYALTHGFRPLAYSTVRYGVATTLFTWFTYGRERSFRVRRRDLALIVLAAALGVWLNQLSYVYALTYSSASTIALILGATPIFTALIAFAIGLERLHRRFWIAAVVSFGGVALIAFGKPGGVSGSIKGDLLGIATAATWAAYTVAIAPLMRSYSPYRISALVLAIGWVAVAITGAQQTIHQSFHFSTLVWACLAYAIVGPLVLTNILWFKAVDRVGPSRATLVSNLQPFIAAIFAVVLLSETMTWLQVGGGALIAGGIVLARRRRSPDDAVTGVELPVQGDPR
ncbi:MAG: DMT family transporter [Gaiellaceae bacterium]